MEIKIQCNCGTKYKFEFEPVNGRVPFEVKCPSCGVDGTEVANSHVQQSMGTPSVESVGSAAVPQAPKLRVRLHAQAPAAIPETASPAEPPSAAPTPRFFTPPPVTAYNPPDEGLSPKFFLGLLGGLLGVLLGCGIWYLIFHFTGTHIRLLAVLVGLTAGLGAKWLSKDEGSSQLGMLTAAFVLIGIVLTAYFIGRERIHNFAGGFEGDLYKEQVAYAKRAMKIVPTGTEEEIRLFLAKEAADEGEKPDLAAVENSEIRLFRDVRLAHYKELASGQIREADFFKIQRRWDFEEEVANAKYALGAMPNESDSEIRKYLAQEYAEPGEKPDLRSISTEDIQHFRANELPELKALASGEKQFEDNLEHAKSTKEALDDLETETGWMKFIYFFSGWGMGGIGIMCITLGLSYKICTHA